MIKALLALALIAGPAAAQVDISIDFGPPPAEYIATTNPIYFEGHPAYFYNDYWHYRDERGRWIYYRTEPRFLAERRAHHMPVRRYYEHPIVLREYRR
jgi:hypothetical protein